jgi:hypothetical protein
VIDRIIISIHRKNLRHAIDMREIRRDGRHQHHRRGREYSSQKLACPQFGISSPNWIAPLFLQQKIGACLIAGGSGALDGLAGKRWRTQ